MNPSHRRHGFTIVELIVIIAIIGILIGMLLPAIRTTREPARRTSCMNNLRQLALAAHNFESAHMRFPSCIGADGQTGDASLLSGFVEVLPYIEKLNLYEQINQPYTDGATNFPPRPAPWTKGYPPYETQLEVFQCPSNGAQDDGPFGQASYAFCIGDRAKNVARPESTRGAFGGQRGTRMDEVSDGTSNTIMFSEICFRDPATNKVFINAGREILDSPVSVLDLADADQNRHAEIELSGVKRGYCWADGRSGAAQFNTILPPNSPTVCVDEVGSDGFFSASGPHPGIVTAVRVDGSTHMIGIDIDCGDLASGTLSEQEMKINAPSPFGVWGALGTVSGSDIVDSEF